MSAKQPLLIEHDRPFVDATLRRRLLAEAEARGVSPLTVLLEHYASKVEAEIDAACRAEMIEEVAR